MKKILFVSTGRCGTKRIYELLRECLPDDIAVVHQMNYSRIANILGTITLATKGKMDCSFFYDFIVKPYCRDKSVFISTDPLSSMIIPEDILMSPDTCIIHLVRPDHDFASSMYSLSRARWPSFLAHNFIPFWTPGILPLENLLNKDVREKYSIACNLKNQYLEDKYKNSIFYRKVDYRDIFAADLLAAIVNDFLKLNIAIPASSLARRSNES